jgi:phosphoglycerate dehydrogenase-like enzyme
VTSAPLLFVGGPRSVAIESSVRAGGGQLTSDPAAATAIVWLSKGVDDLHRMLHDRIRWVQLPDAGVERWVDAGLIDDARDFTSAQGCYGVQVAEHALALTLACVRDLTSYARASRWNRPELATGRLIAGSRVLVVGAGDIGSRLILMLRALGAVVTAVTRSGGQVPGAEVSLAAEQLHSALPDADLVVLCAPSTPRTRALFGRREFALMKRTAFLVNVSRGDLVDTAALVDAVREGAISGAGLDVVDPEPLPADSDLWRLPGVLITPHVANPAGLKEAALAQRVRENTERFAAGRDLVGLVRPDRGY